MRFARTLLLGLALGAAVPGMAAAAEGKACLSPDERRAAIAAHKAGPLAHAMHVVKAKGAGGGVKARLCRQERGLRYVLTGLAQEGEVAPARVGAGDGDWA